MNASTIWVLASLLMPNANYLFFIDVNKSSFFFYNFGRRRTGFIVITDIYNISSQFLNIMNTDSTSIHFIFVNRDHYGYYYVIRKPLLRIHIRW